MVESLTSYITRVARAHFLPPWVVVTRSIAPCYRKVKVSSNGQCDLFGRVAVTLNGNCTTAMEGAAILEGLTGRSGLWDLTLHQLNGVISPAALLHEFEHWCPLCLKTWNDEGGEPYVPLLWQLRVVTLCPSHGGQLVSACPHCG